MKMITFGVKKNIKMFGKDYPLFMKIERVLFDVLNEEWYFTLAYYVDEESVEAHNIPALVYEWIENNLDKVDEEKWTFLKENYIDKKVKNRAILKEEYKFGSDFYSMLSPQAQTLEEFVKKGEINILPSIIVTTEEDGVEINTLKDTEEVASIIKDFVVAHLEIFNINEITSTKEETIEDYKQRLLDKIVNEL